MSTEYIIQAFKTESRLIYYIHKPRAKHYTPFWTLAQKSVSIIIWNQFQNKRIHRKENQHERVYLQQFAMKWWWLSAESGLFTTFTFFIVTSTPLLDQSYLLYFDYHCHGALTHTLYSLESHSPFPTSKIGWSLSHDWIFSAIFKMSKIDF